MPHSTSSQTHRVLMLLKTKGRATNYELNKIAFRYGDCIFRLRKEGHDIESIRKGGGLWEFVYRDGEEVTTSMNLWKKLARIGRLSHE